MSAISITQPIAHPIEPHCCLVKILSNVWKKIVQFVKTIFCGCHYTNPTSPIIPVRVVENQPPYIEIIISTRHGPSTFVIPISENSSIREQRRLIENLNRVATLSEIRQAASTRPAAILRILQESALYLIDHPNASLCPDHDDDYMDWSMHSDPNIIEIETNDSSLNTEFPDRQFHYLESPPHDNSQTRSIPAIDVLGLPHRLVIKTFLYDTLPASVNNVPNVISLMNRILNFIYLAPHRIDDTITLTTRPTEVVVSYQYTERSFPFTLL